MEKHKEEPNIPQGKDFTRPGKNPLEEIKAKQNMLKGEN